MEKKKTQLSNFNKRYEEACTLLRQAMFVGELKIFTYAIRKAVLARWGVKVKITIEIE